MAARKPISLLKSEDSFAETWPDEPDRFQEEHVDSFLLWCVKQNSSDITIQSDRPVYNEIHGALYPGTFKNASTSLDALYTDILDIFKL